jgi:hypothetical protein
MKSLFLKKNTFSSSKTPKGSCFYEIERNFSALCPRTACHISIMKDCPEIEELLLRVIGDDVVGFFERKLTTSEQEVRVFTPVYSSTKPQGLVN